MLHRFACAAVMAAALMAGCDPGTGGTGDPPPGPTPTPTASPSPTASPTPSPTDSPMPVTPRLTVGASRGELRSTGFTLSVLVGATVRPTDARSGRHQLVLGDDASR